jgi:hypothetical protein
VPIHSLLDQIIVPGKWTRRLGFGPLFGGSVAATGRPSPIAPRPPVTRRLRIVHSQPFSLRRYTSGADTAESGRLEIVPGTHTESAFLPATDRPGTPSTRRNSTKEQSPRAALGLSASSGGRRLASEYSLESVQAPPLSQLTSSAPGATEDLAKDLTVEALHWISRHAAGSGGW